MIKSPKKVKDLSLLLSKDDALLISEAIGMLRDEEPFEGGVALLTSFYDKSDNNLVKKTIENFLNDLKDLSAASEIMAEIRKSYKQSTISMLVASCWQSGLDYSEYTQDLVEVFLRSDYVTALECLTVIEESAHELSLAKRKELIKIITEYPLQHSDEKSGLAQELITILKQE